MARIRSTKPEFWTSDKVVECEIATRLLFIGLWSFADDGGVMKDSPKRIKMEVFPADDFDSTTIRGMLDELSKNGLIKYFTVKETRYIKVLGWHHQKIDKPSFKYPQPNGVIPKSRQQYIDCQTNSVRLALVEPSPPESSRVESSRRESKGVEVEEIRDDDDETSPNNFSQEPERDIFTSGITNAQTVSNPEHPVWNWVPSKNTMSEFLNRFSIPEKFIQERLSEFKSYWSGRQDGGPNYDAKFMANVQSNWKKLGHNWQPSPQYYDSTKSIIDQYGGWDDEPKENLK
jgi:hypothetical protein